ncbi:Ribosome hibernation promoting factor [Azospirillaceae bacterium]
MHLTVKGKQLDVGDALRSHVADTLQNAVAKYFGHSIEANVVFSREAHLFRADISVHAGRGIMVQSIGEDQDAYVAFDAACDKIAKRLRRYKRRLRDHHASAEVAVLRSAEQLHARHTIIEAEAEDHHDEHAHDQAPAGHQPVIIAEMTTHIEVLTVGEAVMRMELADLPALMFRNRSHLGLNMVYRRADGNIGWVDPPGSSGSGS